MAVVPSGRVTKEGEVIWEAAPTETDVQREVSEKRVQTFRDGRKVSDTGRVEVRTNGDTEWVTPEKALAVSKKEPKIEEAKRKIERREGVREEVKKQLREEIRQGVRQTEIRRAEKGITEPIGKPSQFFTPSIKEEPREYKYTLGGFPVTKGVFELYERQIGLEPPIDYTPYYTPVPKDFTIGKAYEPPRAEPIIPGIRPKEKWWEPPPDVGYIGITEFKRQVEIKEIAAIREKGYMSLERQFYGGVSAVISPFTTEEKVERLAKVGGISLLAGAAITFTAGAAAPLVGAVLATGAGVYYVPKVQEEFWEAKGLGPVAYREKITEKAAETGVAILGYKAGAAIGTDIGRTYREYKWWKKLPKYPEAELRARLSIGGIEQRQIGKFPKEIQTTFGKDIKVITQERAARIRAFELFKTPLKRIKPPTRLVETIIGTDFMPKKMIHLERVGRFDVSKFTTGKTGRLIQYFTDIRVKVATIGRIKVQDLGIQTKLFKPKTDLLYRKLPPPPKLELPPPSKIKPYTGPPAKRLDLGRLTTQQITKKLPFVDVMEQPFPREEFAAIFGAEKAALIPKLPISKLGLFPILISDRILKPDVKRISVTEQIIDQTLIPISIAKRELLPRKRITPILIPAQIVKPITIPKVDLGVMQKQDIIQEQITGQITEQIKIPRLGEPGEPPPPGDPYKPSPPPPGIPLFPTFKGIRGRPKKGIRRVRRRFRMPTRYTPSLVGTAIGRYARRKPKLVTGIGIRPIVGKKRKKRRGYSMNKIFGI